MLDQSKISGIGNIYADEILFESKIHPSEKIAKLSEQEVISLYKNIKKILLNAIKNRGTSFSDYKDANGQKGHNQNFLKVYSRKGQNCLVCGNELEKSKIAGRGTVYCSTCQVLKS